MKFWFSPAFMVFSLSFNSSIIVCIGVYLFVFNLFGICLVSWMFDLKCFINLETYWPLFLMVYFLTLFYLSFVTHIIRAVVLDVVLCVFEAVFIVAHSFLSVLHYSVFKFMHSCAMSSMPLSLSSELSSLLCSTPDFPFDTLFLFPF